MSWREIELVWTETEHEWNNLGHVVKNVDLPDDDFYAKNVYIWKGVELGNVVDETVATVQNAIDFIDNPELLIGFALTVSALNLFPVYVKRIEEDDDAEKFLSLVKKVKGQYFFIASELAEHLDIKYLIEHFIKLKILKRDGNKLVVQGKILNRVHIKN